MLFSDRRIKGLIESGSIQGADVGRVGPVSYDLATESFYSGGVKSGTVTLKPGESAFVGSVEIIDLPADVACRILLRNSRIRQGLALDAPLYFPGHKTRVFFRVTNVSSDEITLDTANGIASAAFEDVSEVDEPYNGAFSEEFDFAGMGDYHDIYKDDLAKIEKKSRDVEGVERRMYGNVIVLMGIFVGVFSLVNVNIMSMVGQIPSRYMVAMNLATVGSLSTLFALVSLMLRSESDRRIPQMAVACAIAVVAFSAAMFLTI